MRITTVFGVKITLKLGNGFMPILWSEIHRKSSLDFGLKL